MSKTSNKLKVETLKSWLESFRKKTRIKVRKSYEDTPPTSHTK